MFAKRLVELYANTSGKLSYSAAEAAGADVTLKGVGLDIGDGTALPIGDIVFRNVAQNGADWTAERAEFTDMNTTNEGTTIVLSGVSMDGLVLPGDPATPFLLYDRAAMKTFNVSVAGAQVFAMNDYVADVTYTTPIDTVSFTSAAESITVTVPATDAKSAETATALFGGPSVTGRMVMNGAWTNSNGRMELSEMSLDVPGSGKLNMAFSLDGYTLQFMKTLQEVTEAASQGGNSEQAQAAQGMAMLGLMQQLSFVSTMIRYEDAGLATKALDEIAKQQGRDKAQIVNETKAIIPFGLAQLQKPEFSAAVTKAVSDFLDNPKSFTVKAAPAAPVPGALLMATGMGNPADLIDQLSVTVTAND
jgi:hypothetical protein